MKDSVQKIVSFGSVSVGPSQLPEIDSDNILLLPALDLVMFPDVALPIMLTRETSLNVIKYAESKNLPVCVICQKPGSNDFPTSIDDLNEWGVIADIHQIIEIPDGRKAALVHSRPCLRARLLSVNPSVPDIPGLTAKIEVVRDAMPRSFDKSMQAIVNQIKEMTGKILAENPEAPAEMRLNIQHITDPVQLINFISTQIPLPLDKRLSLLRKNSMRDRAKALLKTLYESSQMLEILNDIRQEARESIGENQRRAFLQQQYDVIHDELFGDEDNDMNLLREKADKAGLPEAASDVFTRELRKLERFNPSSPDYAVLFSYLELITELPWSNSSELNTDFPSAQEILENDHYGMEKVKERILEQVALAMRSPDLRAPIICLVGAPGVGKTSLGQSVAKALGRVYERVSLGGMHDEAEIRGHRRTYIGSMPGRIMAAIKKAGVNNPVLLLDEIDKLGSDFKGDPSAALLEVLDPEQNSHFHDNYIDLDFDLSNVVFLATANSLDTLSRPLLDRMEIIEMPGYLPEEKIEIAKRHLIPSVRQKHNLTDQQFDIDNEAILYIIERYTAESGVRMLEKKIAELARKSILSLARGKETPSKLTVADIRSMLGLETYDHDRYDNTLPAGVATGLAWTSVGGEILFVESSLSPAKSDRLTLTGNLGNVMKESAMIACQYIRAHADKLGIDPKVFEENEIHIHVPEGAIPKDGPSAGITIVTSLVSLLTGRPLAPRVAMSGEMTLRGRVLPVGGLKEKILAAKRSGITDIYLSERNRKDIEDINEAYRENMTFHYVKEIDEVLECLVKSPAKES